MKLIKYVNAHLALALLSKKEFPYSVSLKLVTLKKKIAPKVEFYSAEENKLAARYACKDEKGHPIISGGRFECVGDTDAERHANAKEFEAKRRELGLTDDDETFERVTVKVPEDFALSPESLEALSDFVEFEVTE